MSRKILVYALWAVAIVACVVEQTPETTRPNFVFFLIDDLGWLDTGTYGSTFYETPHIDRLAAEGTRFTQFYTGSPVCSPTLDEDISEIDNLAANMPQKAGELRKLLDNWRRHVGAKMPIPNPDWSPEDP